MTVNGEKYKVELAEFANSGLDSNVLLKENAEGEKVLAPLEGRFFLTKSASDIPLKIGSQVKKGDIVCYVEAMKTYNAIQAETDGVIVDFVVANGDNVSEDDVLLIIQ